MTSSAFEIFLSYSRRDNEVPDGAPPDSQGWVTALRDHILADHRRFSTEPLRIFFDTCPESGIKVMDDWRHRILGGLRSSKILLVCLSPNYFRSEYCRWEWEEYVRRQVHQLMGHESITPVYFVEVPGSDEQQNAADFDRWVKAIEPWKNDVLRSQAIDIRPWFPAGSTALRDEEVRKRMAKLGESLWERLQRARRADGVPGNLRRQNPYFVGRREELRTLHEQLGVGPIGVVTAVHGLGGQGKTELAVAYAHGFADCYPAGLWVLGAEGKRDLLPLIGELAYTPELNFTPTEAQKNDPVLLGRAVLVELQRRASASRDSDADGGAAALVILDNVSDAALLSTVQLGTLPRADWLRIVATTRLGEESLRASQKSLALVAVDSLVEDDALALVRDHQPNQKFSSSEDEAAAREIVRELGGFTLAVEQVAVYLGLHPSVTPRALLASLREKGLTRTDELATKLTSEGRAGEIQHQQKQLGLILEATLAMLDPASQTALQFAALLPPDTVPWPWLRTLTTARYPELTQFASDEPDPWLEIRRRLEGLRLLTSGDQPEIARIHRLIAAHVQGATAAQSGETSLTAELRSHLVCRADDLSSHQMTPEQWELNALLVALTQNLDARVSADSQLDDLANATAYFAYETFRRYCSLPATAQLLTSAHRILTRLAESDCSTLRPQRNLSIVLNHLGNTAEKQGDFDEAKRFFGESLRIRQRLAESDPDNAELQRDLALSLENLGDLAEDRGDLAEALQFHTDAHRIAEHLAVSDSTNGQWQRDLSISVERLGDLSQAQGDLAGAEQFYAEEVRIAECLVARDVTNATWQNDLGRSLRRLGLVALKRGDLTGALRRLTEAKNIAEHLVASDRANMEWQEVLSRSLYPLGDLAMAQGDLASALRFFTEDLRISKCLATSDPTNVSRQRGLAVAYQRVAEVNYRQNDLVSAEPAFRESLRLFRSASAMSPSNVTTMVDVAEAHELLAKSLDTKSKESRAERRTLLEHGMDIRTRLEGQLALAYGHREQLAALEVAFRNLPPD